MRYVDTTCCVEYADWCCFFVKQKTAYDMRISDWSSDVCSSDLATGRRSAAKPAGKEPTCSCEGRSTYRSMAIAKPHQAKASTLVRIFRTSSACPRAPVLA